MYEPRRFREETQLSVTERRNAISKLLFVFSVLKSDDISHNLSSRAA